MAMDARGPREITGIFELQRTAFTVYRKVFSQLKLVIHRTFFRKLRKFYGTAAQNRLQTRILKFELSASITGSEREYPPELASTGLTNEGSPDYYEGMSRGD